MYNDYLCKICCKDVTDDDDALGCDHCQKWFHIECININRQSFVKLKNDPLPWYCFECETLFPFSKISNISLASTITSGDCQQTNIIQLLP